MCESAQTQRQSLRSEGRPGCRDTGVSGERAVAGESEQPGVLQGCARKPGRRLQVKVLRITHGKRFYCVNLTELVFMLQRSGCRVCFPILPKGSCWSVELGRAMQLPMPSLPKIVHRHACFVCAPGPNSAPAKKAHPSPRGIEPAPPSTSGSDTAAGAGSFQGLGRYLRLQPPSLRASEP